MVSYFEKNEKNQKKQRTDFHRSADLQEEDSSSSKRDIERLTPSGTPSVLLNNSIDIEPSKEGR